MNIIKKTTPKKDTFRFIKLNPMRKVTPRVTTNEVFAPDI